VGVDAVPGQAHAAAVERLSPEDARILGLETGPIAGHTLKALFIEQPPGGPPTLDAVRHHVASRIERVPRCQQRVVSDDAGPVWGRDPSFSIERHVRALAPGGPVDRDRLLELVAQVMCERLDRSHPLWSFYLLPALGDGTWAVIWKLHHCMADGLTSVRWAAQLLWDAEPASSSPGGAAPSANAVHRQAPPGSPATPSAGGWRAAGRAVARSSTTLTREFLPLTRSSPMSGPIGRQRQVAFARCRLDDLRRVGGAFGTGVTINDVLLAVVAGGLRRWLRSLHGPVAATRVKIPVSMHPQGSEPDPLGNRDSFLFVDLPLSEPDAVTQLLAIHRETRDRKNHHDATTLYAIFDGLGHRCPPLYRYASKLALSPRVFSLNVSNVPGPQTPVSVMGGRVRELYSLAEVAQRHALRISAISLSGGMFIGLCADPKVVKDLDTLRAGISQSIDELVRRAAERG
jgi:diacylglycerol O-acyltransferase